MTSKVQWSPQKTFQMFVSQDPLQYMEPPSNFYCLSFRLSWNRKLCKFDESLNFRSAVFQTFLQRSSPIISTMKVILSPALVCLFLFPFAQKLYETWQAERVWEEEFSIRFWGFRIRSKNCELLSLGGGIRTKMTGAWHSIVVWRLNASLEYVYTCLYWCVFLWAGVSMFWSTVHICKSLYQPESLLTLHTVSSLTAPPEAEPNERISIRQQWILNCARTDGWISRNGASFQQDLRKCLRKGCSGETGWARVVAQHTAAVLEYYLFNYSKILMKSLYESYMAWD